MKVAPTAADLANHNRSQRCKTTVLTSSNNDIHANVCYKLFLRYEEDTGAVWVSITCGWWLHE